MIEREGEANARALHDGKARRIDRRKLVQVGAPEIRPRQLQIAQLAGKNPDRAGFIDRLFPCQRHVPVGVAFEESEGLDDDGNRAVQFGAGRMERLPLLAGLSA